MNRSSVVFMYIKIDSMLLNYYYLRLEISIRLTVYILHLSSRGVRVQK